MATFDSFEELKKFMDSMQEFLSKRDFPLPIITPTGPEPLDDTEKNIITTIYNSYREKGTTIRQIAGNFLHLLQLLVPSKSYIDIFKHLIYLEWMEHRIKPGPAKRSKLFYRDHILHCANVCWVGEHLLFKLEEPLMGQVKSCLEGFLPMECRECLTEEKHWEFFIKVAWYITAMVHDFGYPIELVEQKYTGDDLYLCSKHFLKSNKAFSNYFDEHFPGCIAMFKEQLGKIDKKKLENPRLDGDKIHSVVGSLELLHFLGNNYGKIGEPYRSIYQLSALGILEHHKEGEIDFDLDPFGYILSLADTIHEWHRYVCVGAAGHGSPKLKFLSPITKVSIEKQGIKHYKIRFKINRQRKKCAGWDPGIFKDSKEKELKRLKEKDGLPRFVVEI